MDVSGGRAISHALEEKLVTFGGAMVKLYDAAQEVLEQIRIDSINQAANRDDLEILASAVQEAISGFSIAAEEADEEDA